MPNQNLTTPIINRIIPFDATITSSKAIDIVVIGGGLVSSVDIRVVNASDGLWVDPSIQLVNVPVVDNSGLYIRNITTSIPLVYFQDFENGNNYNIFVRTYSVNTPSSDPSEWSTPQLIQCYATPEITLNYYVGTTLTKLSNNNIITSHSLSLYPQFIASNLTSVFLSSLQLRLKGVISGQQGSTTIIYTTPLIYDIGDPNNPIVISPFFPTSLTPSEGRYEYYELDMMGVTNDGMVISSSITRIGVNYSEETNLSNISFTATNMCNEGYISLDVDFSGASFASSIDTIVISRQALSDDADDLSTNSEWVSLMRVNAGAPTARKFNMLDTYNQCGVSYNYRATAYGQAQNPLLSIYSGLVYSYFNDAYVCDAYNSFSVYNALEYSGYERIQQVETYVPFGSKYPLINKNNSIDYSQGTLSFISLSQATMVANGDIARLQEVKKRKSLNDFLVNGFPKILKDYNGNIWVIFVTSSPSNAFFSALGNGISTTNYSWVEISDLSQDGLDAIGMLGYFPILYSNGTIAGYIGNLRDLISL